VKKWQCHFGIACSQFAEAGAKVRQIKRFSPMRVAFEPRVCDFPDPKNSPAALFCCDIFYFINN
jgi:hypothetical protein